MTTLNFVEFCRRHVVAQVVETKFVICSVGDVGRIVDSLLFGAFARTRNNKSNVESEPAMHATHPFRVTTRQVIVHRDEVNSLTRQSVEVGRQGGDQRLTFTSFHFGDPTEVQCCSTHHLHVVVTLPNDTMSTFANDGESFDQKVVEGFASLESSAEFGSLAT